MNLKSLSRSQIGWVLYDFGNSAYATTILSVVFSVYLTKVIIPPEGLSVLGFLIPSESVWGYVISLVMLTVLLISPGLGAIADHFTKKREFLVLWTALGAAATLLLYWAEAGRVWYSIVIIYLATVGYELSLSIYNALLNDIAADDEKGKLSGYGFAVGYLGGGICLGLNMAMIAKPEWFGLSQVNYAATRMTFVVVGLWWFVFSIPSFMWVKEKGKQYDIPAGEKLAKALQSLAQFKETIKFILSKKELSKFLLAYLIFNDGIQTILLMAAIFGSKALGMTTAQMGLCFLLIQFVAFGGASFFGPLADRWSHRKVLLLSLAVFTAVGVWAIFIQTQFEFWVMGVIVGIVMGASQAAARSMFAVLIPPEKSGELFGFYSVVGKAASLIGPLFFAVASQFFGLRAGVGSIVIFFVVGAVILYGVDEEAGRTTRVPRE